MHHRVREVVERHLHPVIRSPERRAKAITDTLEPTARSCVCLKHKEWLASTGGKVRRVSVRGSKGDDRHVGEVVAKDVLWDFYCGTGVELCRTIVARVTGAASETVSIRAQTIKLTVQR